MGYLEHNKFQRDNILRRLNGLSLLDCAKECLTTALCVGFNFRKNWQMCEVVGGVGHQLITEAGCLFSLISTWPKV